MGKITKPPKKRTDVMKNSPFRDRKGRMPLWLEIEAEIGYLNFEMQQIARSMPNSPIAKMIDDVTGFSKHKMEYAVKVARRMIELKKALSHETGKDVDIALEGEIIALIPSPTVSE